MHFYCISLSRLCTVLFTFSGFCVPAQLQADGSEQVPDEDLDLLVEFGVGQKAGQHPQVTAQVAPHGVVRLIDKRLHQFEHLHCADHPRTGLEEEKTSLRHLFKGIENSRALLCFD